MSGPVRAELIVLSAPLSHDSYYADVKNDILDFQVGFAKKIKQAGDQVLILVDKKSYTRYRNFLDADHLFVYPMSDIWARDFGLSNPELRFYFNILLQAKEDVKEMLILFKVSCYL